MTRDVKLLKKGGAFFTETITIRSGNPTPEKSVLAYKDLILTLQSCIDSGLLRANYNAPNKILIVHTPEGWVIEATSIEDEPEPTTQG